VKPFRPRAVYSLLIEFLKLNFSSTRVPTYVFILVVLPDRRVKSDYVLSAANVTPINTYGTIALSLNFGEISLGDL
jgi:hypothetical protein